MGIMRPTRDEQGYYLLLPPSAVPPGQTSGLNKIYGETIMEDGETKTWLVGRCNSTSFGRAACRSLNEQVSHMVKRFEVMMEYTEDEDKACAALGIIHCIDFNNNKWKPTGDQSDNSAVEINTRKGLTRYYLP
jgi:hypothetical protein